MVNGADGNDRGVKELIELMQRHGLSFYAKNNSSGIIGKNDVVIIKVNSQWDERGAPIPIWSSLWSRPSSIIHRVSAVKL